MVSKRWNLIRLYASDQQSENVLSVIREHSLPIRVMQGAWISGHQTDAENNQQIRELIRLAREYADIVVAVNVGNEIIVDWSWHRVGDMDSVIEYIRRVRAQISQPVTVNDDYNFWNKPRARKIVNEVDFIGLHAYAFWNNKTIDEALSWTQGIYTDIS
jgi:exo-beta-1,3-glucanase (GH17 family)